MVSDRVENMKPSATSTFAGRILELRTAGVDIASFNVGEPDFPTPEKIVRACEEALTDGRTKYTAIGGIPELRRAIARKLEKDNSIFAQPDQICVTVGAKQAVYNAVLALCNEGDEVIIPTPCWVSYVEMVKLAGGVPVLVPTGEGHHLDLPKIAGACSGKTKLIILNSPNNPTGAVYTGEELASLARLALEHNFYVISDEVYEKLLYGEARHISIASLSPEIADKTVTVNGFSKAYSMTGWRLGYAAGPKEIIRAMISLQGHETANATAFVQYAAVTALQECGEEVEAMRQAFEQRRDAMLRLLLAMPGITCEKPDGAFYLLPDVSAYFGKSGGGRVISTSGDLCEYLLDEAHVAVVAGAAFEAPNCLRIAYAASMETITEGMARMERALGKLH